MRSPAFRLKSLQAIPLRVPFSDQVTGARAQPQGWREFDMVLVRAETTDAARRAQSELDARGRTQKFLGTGTAYAPH